MPACEMMRAGQSARGVVTRDVRVLEQVQVHSPRAQHETLYTKHSLRASLLIVEFVPAIRPGLKLRGRTCPSLLPWGKEHESKFSSFI